MTATEQLNMFEKKNDPIWSEFRSLENKQEHLRKGIFARYGAILKLVASLQTELSELRQSRKNTFKELELFQNQQ